MRAHRVAAQETLGGHLLDDRRTHPSFGKVGPCIRPSNVDARLTHNVVTRRSGEAPELCAVSLVCVDAHGPPRRY